MTLETAQAKPGVSGSVLKTVAIVTMLIDHLSFFLRGQIPFLTNTLFTLSIPNITSKEITLYYIMRSVGRIAFPLFCFLLVEGWKHSSNRFRYGLCLLIGAIVSEYPFDLANFGGLSFKHQNVFFTLFLGLIGLWLYDRFRDSRVIQALTLIALFVVTFFLKTDYSIKGVAFILLIYVAQTELPVIGFIGCVLFQIASFPAYLLIGLYNGKRGFIKGPVLKYAFYAFYPVHLMVIYLIQQALS